MEKFRIHGGRRLEGTVRVSGAKNAALPAMAAALLTSEPVHLRNVPRVRDIVTMGKLLAHMEAQVEMSPATPDAVSIRAERVSHAEAPYELVKTMRASVLTLGPLVARTGYARVSLPGGCAIGARPIDLHIQALEKLGAEISTEHGYVEARAQRLRGARLLFDKITVTGTENAMMAAALAEGESLLENAAREPEISDLAALLNAMGARVEGAGTSTVRIRGVPALHGATHTIIPDRIEAGTLLVAGAITGGELLLTHCEPAHLTAVIEKLEQSGIVIRAEAKGLRVHNGGPLAAVDVTTEEYPGFATDMQAQYMALMTQAAGTSVITETIFENRFLHAQEMVRMGGQIVVEGRRAVVRGPARLSGASVQASDLRASASLVLAALVAEGETIIDRVYHLDRGYERLEQKLGALGARIERVN
ncbi:MAG: UDP-N-acetylglucosamine 1-carboxyvinyltransferase [Acidobacteria bacterium]|nr:UDP-N-acetylglucosamine 1-carboxyvinyltransferase [Acidobacteriota bacterium]MCL5288797.1 UDP-N-acetylglucosamine 1-carboxyvinyltransferase [Acidobacteriota bacterium]